MPLVSVVETVRHGAGWHDPQEETLYLSIPYLVREPGWGQGSDRRGSQWGPVLYC